MRLFTALFVFWAFLMAMPAFTQQLYPVHFSMGTEFFPDNFQAIRRNPDVSPEEIINGYYIRYIQCTAIPRKQTRAVLEAEGFQFIHYVPFGVYLVAIPEHFDLVKLEPLRVRSVVPVKAGWKLAGSLLEKPYGSWAVHGHLVDVHLQVYPNVRVAEAAQWFVQQGITVLQTGNQNGFLAVRIPETAIANLAASPMVEHMELAPPPSKPEDINGRSLHRANLLDSDYPTGKKYNGSGVRVLVRDDGPVGPHIDFQGRNTNIFDSGDPANNSHGDGVAGIMAGAGNLNPVMKGMAAGADVFTIRYRDDFQDNTLPLHWDENVTITNSSYSNGCNAGYTITAQTVDYQLFDNPTLLHVFSAGNENGANCGYGAGSQWGNITGGHKVAKNCVTTANVHADATLAVTSSRGPAHDGRLKPDISAHGNYQNSTDANNTYQTFSGTSAAAPGIAGCLAQLTQAYKDIYNGEQPTAAVLKAVLLNTANELGNTGPDFKFGWGMVNAYRAYQALLNHQWMEGSSEQGELSTHAIQIPSGTRLAKIMVYWPDVPASLDASRALINDLDLTVKAPDGALGLPWKLDPTPDPVILDTPAGKGRDSLNNAEQVALVNPAPGTYTVTVDGFEVPFGPQSYVLTWEFLNDQIKITYPAGGEGLVPGEITRIHWDAYGTADNFTLRYSTDNGASWIPITTVTGEKRMYDWTVPSVISGRVRLMILRQNLTDTTDFPLSIAPVPTGLQVLQVCPDSMTVAWTPAPNDTLQYNVYLLGQKYMELAGTTDTSVFTLAIQNPSKPQWFSVGASDPGGLTGRRAPAVQWPGNLKNCTQPDDLRASRILSPTAVSSLSCSPFSTPVSVRIINDGQNPISGALLNYQLNADPTVSENLPDIGTGDTLDFAFQKTVTITQNGANTLRVWSTYGAEDVWFNDTLSTTFNAIVSPAKDYFLENFQGSSFPPVGWAVGNPDEGVTWGRTSFSLTGSGGQPTRATYIQCFDYPQNGEEDFLYLIPVDLSEVLNPGLRFDLSHSNYPDQFERLRVEVLANCDLNGTPVVIWEKSDTALATTTESTSEFTPNSAQDWRPESVSLQDFAGQTVIIRFVSTNDYGNNIYLDNIGLYAFDANPPVANFTANADTICRLDTIRYTALPAGLLASYSWNFGSGAIPSTAFGQGPHPVYYITAGDKKVQLNVANPNGADSLIRTIPVLGTPIANYSWSANGPTVTFSNTSVNCDAFQWNFGDGGVSDQANPVHVYPGPGTYTATLAASNTCRSSVKTQTFTVTAIGALEQNGISRVRILPNPTDGNFQVDITAVRPAELQFRLLDASGRLIMTTATAVPTGRTAVPFGQLNLAKGIYQLLIQTDDNVQAFRIAVH